MNTPKILCAAIAAALLLVAPPADAGKLEIPMGPVAAAPRPVRLAAADRVGRMVFAQYYRPTLEDAIPDRTSVLREPHELSIEDWLDHWGTIRIQQIGRPF